MELTRLVEKIRACALCRPLLVGVDGWRAYPTILRHVFREATPSRRERPHLRLWDRLVIAQVIKQYEYRRVIGVLHRVVEGTAVQVTRLGPAHACNDGGAHRSSLEDAEALILTHATRALDTTETSGASISAMKAFI
jgi:hypothetical protein